MLVAVAAGASLSVAKDASACVTLQGRAAIAPLPGGRISVAVSDTGGPECVTAGPGARVTGACPGGSLPDGVYHVFLVLRVDDRAFVQQGQHHECMVGSPHRDLGALAVVHGQGEGSFESPQDPPGRRTDPKDQAGVCVVSGGLAGAEARVLVI